MRELEKPGRDPREDAPAPVLRSDVLSMEDLQEGMVLTERCGMSLILVCLWILGGASGWLGAYFPDLR